MKMNTIVTSKEEILCVSRDLIQKQGWNALNIRTVAKECNISVGSIYNYFRNKSDLITATVESVWRDIFHFPENPAVFDSFIRCVEWAFDSMKKGEERYPGFFSFHSMIFMEEEKGNGQQLMKESWKHISKGLYQVMGQIVALLVRLRQQHFKFNVRCFIGAGKGGYQQFVVGLVRVLDIVKGFFQR